MPARTESRGGRRCAGRGRAPAPRRRPRSRRSSGLGARWSASRLPRSRAGGRARRRRRRPLRERRLGPGARPDAGASCCERLGDAIGGAPDGAEIRGPARAPSKALAGPASQGCAEAFRFCCYLQGFCVTLRRLSGGPDWYPYVNFICVPRPRRGPLASGSAAGFCSWRPEGTDWLKRRPSARCAGNTEEEGRRLVRRQGHHRPRGPRGGPQAARDVHRLDRPARPAPPRLRGASTTRSTRRSPATATRSRSSCIPTTAAPSPTTAAASRSTMHEKEKRPAAEVVLTTLHAGGKFGDGGGYKVSGGLHGVGVSVVNALSERAAPGDQPRRLRLGRRTTSAASRSAELKRGAKTKETGTKITFLPDLEIFEEIEFDFQTLAERLRETAFLTRGLKIELVDERGADQPGHVPVRGRHRGLRPPPEREQGRAAPQGHLLRRRSGRRPGRGGDAVEHLLPGVDLLLRQQHQHPRGRHPPLRLPLRADPDPERLRARQGPAEGEGRQPRRRGRPRGADRGDLGEAARPAVRGPDQDQARQPADRGLVEETVNRKLGEFLEENPGEAKRIIIKAVEASRARDGGQARPAT